MQIPGNLPLYGDRWTPLACTIEFLGFDFTDATFSMQVRLAGDTPGSPLISLGTVFSAGLEGIRLIYGGTDTVANHIAAGRLNEVPSGLTAESNLEMSQVGILIDEITMEGLLSSEDAGFEPGDDMVLAWDIHITPLAGVKERWLFGDFTVRAGVTV